MLMDTLGAAEQAPFSRITKTGIAASLIFASQAAMAAPTIEELAEIVAAQQEQIDELQTGKGSENKVYIGGYGELHYNNLSADNPANDTKEIDFHRFVLFFGYDFSPSVRFYSEFELEHALAGESKPGEVELEQAYVQFDIDKYSDVLGGVLLLPVGMMNLTHEPPTFYGVERNDVENIIIPATWWAGGAQYTRRFGDFTWQLAVHEGLSIPTTGGNAFRVRSGRQKTAEASASDIAATTALRYVVPGLEIGGSLHYQEDASQTGGDGLDDAILYEAHVSLQKGIFGFKALYAAWNMNGAAVEAADDDSQTGWYVEPSIKPWEKLGFYVRYEDLEGARSRDEFDQIEAGFNYWPVPNVVVKADWRSRSHAQVGDQGRDFDGFDLGIGYNF